MENWRFVFPTADGLCNKLNLISGAGRPDRMFRLQQNDNFVVFYFRSNLIEEDSGVLSFSCVLLRSLSHKSGWFQYCCAPADRPVLRYLFLQNKRFLRKGAGGCGEKLSCESLRPPRTVFSSLSIYWNGPGLFRSLSQIRNRAALPVVCSNFSASCAASPAKR